MKISNNILELIGKTPMVYLNRLTEGLEAKVAVKVESFNPGGSIKDRIALAMVETAEKEGRINKDTVLIEPTSGNTGIGLAMIAAVKGYRLIIAMPDTMSVERRKLMQVYGAELVLTPGALGMKGSIDKALELEKEYGNAFVFHQFKNPANPEIHRQTTAEEIWNDTDGNIDIFVAGIGTGGTFTGVASVLKPRKPEMKFVAVEPEKSAVLSGQPAAPHKIQGIGAGFIPDVMNTDLIEEIIQVSDEDAMSTALEMAKKEGIFSGISAGAAVCAALNLAKRPENKGKLIVTVVPDTGERYLSSAMFPSE